MSETVDLSFFVQKQDDGTVQLDLAVEGITCAACIGKIEDGLQRVPGVLGARLNYTNRRLRVDWREDEVRPDALIRTLENIGYRAHPFAASRPDDEDRRQTQALIRALAVAGFAAMNVMLLSVSVWSGGADMEPETRDFFHWLSALIAIPAAAYAGQPFFSSAWRALRHGGVNMDVPISLGVILAIGLSIVETAQSARHAYFDSAVMLLFFLLCGRLMDHLMRRKTRAVAANLAALKAEFAHRLDDGGELVTVPVEALAVGDRLLLRPGERVPADCVVVSGASAIDESLVTGETAARSVAAGDIIHAGSLNREGLLTLKVTAAGGDTLLADVERLLEQAISARSRYLRLADRAARLYAPVVHTAALLTAIGWMLAGAGFHFAIVTAIAVLIITCPCALALAVPAVQVVVSGSLFRAGLMLHSGDAIERLAAVDVVVFDKTGTLTLPEERVANAAAVEPALLERAARLALSSHHPLARALAREALQPAPYEDAVEEPGSGVRALVDGSMAVLGNAVWCGIPAETLAAAVRPGQSYVAFRHGEEAAVFTIDQVLRPDAVAVAAELQAAGLGVMILSGDRPEAVAPVAAALGVAAWRGGLKPGDKIALLAEMKEKGHRVLMVGDGLNDAPALAAAHASISPISAVDLAQAQADAVFLGERLQPVADALAYARRGRRLMMQNLWLAAIYNVIAVPIAMAGFVTPLIAAVAMSGSSVIVTANALRGRWRDTDSLLNRPRRQP